jgi:signal transduction histidine kinase
VVRFGADDNSAVRATERAAVLWAVECAALVGGLLLLVRGRAAMQPDRASAVAAAATFVVVLVGSELAAIVRIAPLRLAPLLLAVMVPGLTRSDSPRVAVLGFAAVALFPVAALYAAGTRPWRWLSIALSVGALVTFGTRVLYRDPFRELRCAPACMDNPWLRAHAPDLLRGSERVLAVLTLAWVVVDAASQLRRRAAPSAYAASTLVVLAVAAVWATRLLQQPRPAPGDSVDRWLTIGLLGAVAAATVLRALTPLDVIAVHRRIRHFASALSNAGDTTAIRRNLRDATGDESLDLELGDHPTEPSRTSTTTTVKRGGRVVATIRHAPAARSRIAAAVTPATALALETQLLLQQARQQLVELEASRATAVQTTDEARRRLERDLHDGAQQRLLVVGMALAHAADGEASDGPLRAAASRVAMALTDLRRIGRGDAAIIAELGLDDAVTAIAGTSEIPMSVALSPCASPAHDCWPQAVATTAYRLVHASLAGAQRCGAKELAVQLRCLGPGNGRAVSTRHDGHVFTERSADHDRVLASGGRIAIDDGHVFEVWLP